MCGNGRLARSAEHMWERAPSPVQPSAARRTAYSRNAPVLTVSNPSTELRIPNRRAPSLPSPPHRRARCSLAKRLHSNCETSLHHRPRQGRHEVHLLPLHPQREHTRFRPARRQSSHPGSDGPESARRQSSPRARTGFLARRATANLAILDFAESVVVSRTTLCPPCLMFLSIARSRRRS